MEVLIIDDDSDDRAIIGEMLEGIYPGVSCVIIESGEDAIKYLRQPVNIPQYIFLDINMVGMDGKETLLKIKSMKTYSRARVIMYSGNDNEHEKLIYQKLGANGYIKKTASLESLRRELMDAIKIS